MTKALQKYQNYGILKITYSEFDIKFRALKSPQEQQKWNANIEYFLYLCCINPRLSNDRQSKALLIGRGFLGLLEGINGIFSSSRLIHLITLLELAAKKFDWCFGTQLDRRSLMQLPKLITEELRLASSHFQLQIEHLLMPSENGKRR